MASSEIIFVTGATGYIGGRLVPLLLERGYRVRCLARHPRKLASRTWAAHPRVEIVEGDIADPDLAEKMTGARHAYYLVHSMMVVGSEYAARDRRLATGFAAAAAAAGVERILYLGGLGETGSDLSEHLQSRREVEQALARGPVPVTVLRAAMIIGSGSASFEILRYLVERLPVMITPRWVATECQPIAIHNVLHYLVAALDEPRTKGETLDIGGPEVLSYRDIMQIAADCLGLRRRWILPVPVLTPRLSSLWIHLVTPISHRIARPLAEGLRNRVVCRDQRAHELMPQDLLSVRRAIELSVDPPRAVETSWSDAGPIPGDPDWAGGTVCIHREVAEVGAGARAAFRAVERIGGTNGWYAANFLWQLRGWIDRLIGGPGLERGRRSADDLAYGDAVDFWRVIEITPERRLVLRAEMRLPGEAELEFEIEPLGSDPERSRIVQTARFLPTGLVGILYWYAVMPMHSIVFRGMLAGICRRAEQFAGSGTAAGSTLSDR